MKKMVLLLFSVASVSLPAAADSGFATRAKVLNTTPVIETVYEQVEVCRYEYSSGHSRSSSGATGDKVIGGIIGGAAGSAIGKGSGRDAAAAVGAIIGSEVAAQDGELTEGELIGGIAGGIIGNQVGKGSGKTTATAAGALIGALVGNELQGNGSKYATTTKEKIRVCELEEEAKKVVTGYEIELEYDDRIISKVVSKRPGEYIDIYVGIEILEERTSQL